MLRPPKPDEPLQQGDIIRDVPFIVLPKAFNIKATGVPGQVRLDSANTGSFENGRQLAEGDKKLFAVDVPLVLHLGMVITQSCDLDNKDQITLARVYPIEEQVQTAREAIQHNEPFVMYDILRRLTEGAADHGHLAYAGCLDGKAHLVADLLRLHSYALPWKECFRQQRLRCLTDEGLKYLQGRLSNFTGRFATTTGFWQTPDEQERARQLVANTSLIREAHDRLREKKNKPAGP